MPQFDTDTVILSSSAISLGFGLVLAAFAGARDGLRLHWALAAILYGVAGLLIGFRGILPPWLANVIANMLVGASVVLVHRGTWVMMGRRPPDRIYLASIAALGLLYYYFTYESPNIGVRLFAVSMFRVPFLVSAALALRPLFNEGPRRGARVLFWLLLILGVWYMLRGSLAISSESLAVQMRTGTMQGINFLIATAGHLLIITMQFLLESERAVDIATGLAAELKVHRDQLEEKVQARTEDLRKMAQEAERANWAKSHFLAAASHDLRQPLQALRLFLDLLDVKLAGHPEKPVLDMAASALSNSEVLLHSLLDVSRLDAGTVSVEMAPFRLDEVIEKLIQEVAEACARKGVVLRVVPLRIVVVSDLILFERVLRNLLHNALRYTEKGAILIGCRRRDGRVRVEVWDTGIGIPEDKLGIIFEDFYQLANSERDQTKGLGLGLAIVRRIAEMLGCQIEVRSWPGRGSVFSVALPLTSDTAEPGN